MPAYIRRTKQAWCSRCGTRNSFILTAVHTQQRWMQSRVHYTVFLYCVVAAWWLKVWDLLLTIVALQGDSPGSHWAHVLQVSWSSPFGPPELPESIQSQRFAFFWARHIWLYSPTSSLEIGQAHAYSWATLMVSLHLMFWSYDFSVLCFWHIREARDGKKSTQSSSYRHLC